MELAGQSGTPIAILRVSRWRMKRGPRYLIAGILSVISPALILSSGSSPPPDERGAAAAPSPPPPAEPAIFGEGIISTGDYESHPAFTPDAKTIYFLKDTPDFSFWTIVVSTFKDGRWGTLEVAPFSGRYSDADPFITADGSKFFFISNRPVDGHMDGKQKGDLDIWMMERTPSGWSEPKSVAAPVNSPGNEWFPTLSATGTIYFGSDRDGGRGRTDLYRCRLVDGKYAEAENLGDAVNTRFEEFEPLIAPDESYLIFMTGRPGGSGGFDLFYSLNVNGVWTKAQGLGGKINSPGNELSPKVSPDGRRFYFTSTRGFGAAPLDHRLSFQELSKKLNSPGNGLGDIYEVDFSALNLRP